HFKLRPLKELYFFGETAKASYGLHGNFQTIIILIIIGISLLALSGTNYVNLTTAGSTTRFKEVAVKRLTGSSVGMLRVQLMGESVIISLISLGIGLTLVQLLLPKFGALTGVNVSLMRLNDSMLWLKIIGGGIVIGVLSGVYPAFFLTAIQPLLLIKERIKGTRSLFRSALMTFQFTLSVVMIVAIIVIHRQLTFVRSMDLGFDKEQVLMIHTPADIPNEFVLRQQFESRLENIPGVEGVSFSIGSLGIFLSESADMVINGEVRSGSKMLGVDEKYFDVMGLEVLEGRSFSLDSPGDSALLMTPSGARIGGILFNETAMKEYGASVGQRVYVPDGSDSAKQEPRKYFEIVGVVRDFHFQSLHEKIEPLSFIWFHKPGITASIRVSPSNIHATVGAIEAEYKNVWQAGSDYSFLDDTFNKFYARDQQLASVIDCFAVLAVIIASLGLFALSSFMVSGRMKEIGVRKVLGASVGRIYSMLSWDFLRWIVVAVLIGCPIGWYTMNAWLRTFEYRISIGMDVFAIAALLAVGIALLTITWQSINVAKANPVESLRYE
ncbi:MAG TPA: FtsX-like permease family protein, partial [Cyclobacteriaceae bacterium]|nr:FtsX-like permease family protein [Cyclobacteriaceae bacterium]